MNAQLKATRGSILVAADRNGNEEAEKDINDREGWEDIGVAVSNEKLAQDYEELAGHLQEMNPDHDNISDIKIAAMKTQLRALQAINNENASYIEDFKKLVLALDNRVDQSTFEVTEWKLKYADLASAQQSGATRESTPAVGVTGQQGLYVKMRARRISRTESLQQSITRCST